MKTEVLLPLTDIEEFEKKVFEDIEKYEEINWFLSVSWMKKIINRNLTEEIMNKYLS